MEGGQRVVLPHHFAGKGYQEEGDGEDAQEALRYAHDCY